MAIRADLFAHLDAHSIVHKTHEHKAVFTVEESHAIKDHLPGGHTKNLFSKSKDGCLFLLCALGETKIPINHLHKRLGCKRLSFGKPELLQDVLGIKPGSVCLFSLLNDNGGRVELILDQALMGFDLVNFHPLENTATTAISSADMVKFSKSTGHEPVIIDFAKLSA
ncbi:MAG: prolyl-tRNA synthetase associated domain-containing protein [Robiginitomaculum sp.]|nr:prolyl-tRNA synthetase associated domain-containing protein [Robiginitomaculum sp.]